VQNGFARFGLIKPLQAALRSAGFVEPTPVQTQAIAPGLAGRDILGCAQTGSGKTAAFALPLLQRLSHQQKPPRPGRPRALVLAPTRELAHQIGDVFGQLGRHLPVRHTVIYGGVGKQPQIKNLRRGVDILIATPGRLLDLMGEGHLTLDDSRIVVLDEADRMLDMGFIPDVRRIVAALPDRRQSLFFSATIPEPIATLSANMLHDPVRVTIAATVETTPTIDQSLLFVEREHKRALLTDLLSGLNAPRTLVFTRTKHRARNLARQLSRIGHSVDSLHGDKSQGGRRKALDGFHSGSIAVLVATDIAARGLDVDDITRVINYELPHEPEVYVHRIGRTARAGKEGAAVSFCDSTEVRQLRDIERLIRMRVRVVADHDYHSTEAQRLRESLEPAERRAPPRRNGQQKHPRGGRRHHNQSQRSRGRGAGRAKETQHER
jgi:ATP-dependent RNA helicase RhlE